jgi:transcriptional regulator with XRE-family HTH domain
MKITNSEHKAIEHLLDDIKKQAGLRDDAALAKYLNVGHPNITRLRHGRHLMGPEMILAIHDATNMPIREIKSRLKPTQSAPQTQPAQLLAA